ncbi:MAG: ABC transporter permease [Erysipelotrichales bacterium]|nr:ABC transporter permease [Erysipelotrichales bacterium]
MTEEHKLYLKRIKRNKLIITISQFSLLTFFIVIWELLSRYNIINSFIFSSPSKVITTLINLYQDNNLFIHIFTTSVEVILSLILSFIVAFLIALILYSFKTIKKILDPFIVAINSLPKVALGPLIIIWLGTSTKAIVFNSLLISVIVTFMTILNGMESCDKDLIKLFKVFKAKKIDILINLIIPSSKNEIISALKINLSMSLIGVIMGEFLSCKKGIGYLILYGTQVFNLSLVMCGILILSLLSFIFNILINTLEKTITKDKNSTS